MNIKRPRTKLAVFYFIVLLCYIVLPSIVSAFSHGLDSMVQNVVIQIVLIIVSLALMKKWGMNNLTFTLKKDSSTIRRFVLLIPVVFPMVADILFKSANNFSFGNLMKSFFTSPLTGISEELVFRGVILGGLLAMSTHTSKNRWKAILISSILFGSMHLLNLFSSNQVSPTMVYIQVLYATFLGIYLASLFIVSKTLWLPIIAHTLIDLFGFLEQPLGGEELVIFFILYGLVPMICGIIFIKREKN